MIKSLAGWYSLLIGAFVAVLPWAILGAAAGEPGEKVRAAAFTVAGLLLVAGGLAQLARFPGRNAAYYLGAGACGMALVESIAVLTYVGGSELLMLGLAISFALLLVAAWSFWPRS